MFFSLDVGCPNVSDFSTMALLVPGAEDLVRVFRERAGGYQCARTMGPCCSTSKTATGETCMRFTPPGVADDAHSSEQW